MRLNNKGQSLVLFILIIPILLGVMVMVIDIGNVIYRYQDIENINKIVLDYGLDHVGDDNLVYEMENLVLENNEKIDTNISIGNDKIEINSTYYVDGIFSNIFNTKGYLVKSKYVGYKDNDKKKIMKIK